MTGSGQLTRPDPTGAPGAAFSVPAQRLCVWAGLLMVPLFFLGMGVLARFIPPPPPSADAETIARMFDQNRFGIRLGLWVTAGGCALLAPFFAVITVQVRRIEGGRTPLATTQAISAACAVLEFIFPLFAWQAAAYRPDRDPALVQLMNDLAWLPFLGIVSTFVVQVLAVAVAVLRDPRPVPVFPRWAAYLQFFVAFGVAGGSCVVFFQTGPLAWDGLIAWWLLVVAFFIWMAGMAWLLLRAIAQEDHDQSIVAEEADA